MRRQIIGVVAATLSIVLIALLIPMATLVERFAGEDALAAASLEVQATESVVAFEERSDLAMFIDGLNSNEDGTRTTVLFEDGDAIGPDRQVTADVTQARESGQAISLDTSDGAQILVPVAVLGNPDLTEEEPSPEGVQIPVIRVVISESRLSEDVLVSWAIIGGLGAALLVLAVAVADRLARTFVRPVTELAETSSRLEAGELTARTTPGGPREIREVGTALNRLASRIGELLAAERESVADISHRLRTPVTVLRLEAGELRDPEERERLVDVVDELTRNLDDVIREARRPMREGVGAECDATRVVADRAAFWSVLADDQERRMSVDLPPHPLPVKVARDDLAAAVDALLGNVFSHTDDRVGFEVLLAARGGGGAVLQVSDDGRSTGDADEVVGRGESRGGSTGLGLDIARRTAEASGGELVFDGEPGAGTTVRMLLGPPTR